MPDTLSIAAETIFALASGRGPAGVAVIRLSGPAAKSALERMIGKVVPPPRRAVMATIRNGAGEKIDVGIVVYFPGPKSATGEDVTELHVHGGRAVVAAVLDGLAAMPGLRMAEPGEFTRRAFENGRIDLTAAEGIADLVHAETEAQRRQALRQMEGELGALYERWRSELVRALAYLEASIDFVDEELPVGLTAEVEAAMARIAAEIEGHLRDGGRGERVREGIELVIVGPPNAGKSTLLNRIAGYEAAIVSAIPGTTRDIVEVRLDIGGYPVVIADTAGLRSSSEEIEREGVRRARNRAERSDIKLVVLDGATWPTVDAETVALVDEAAVVCVNKGDLGHVDAGTVCVRGKNARVISARAGDEVAALVDDIKQRIASRFEVSGTAPLTRVRHRRALKECREALSRWSGGGDLELAAEDLRAAARALGRITGRVDVEQVLDVVFRDFCIGK